MRSVLQAHAASIAATATVNGDAEPTASEVELAAAGARGPRAAEIATGARDANALRL
jgi:hypothetical protein